MLGKDTIANDLPCRACAYNLRGLSFSGVCPECGEPIGNTFESATAQLAKLLGEDPLNIAHRLKHQPIADEANSSVDAVLFVLDSIDQARKRNPSVELNAATICAAVQARAKSYFNDPAEARELLDEWGLRTGQDIGRITLALAQHHLLHLSKDQILPQFSDLFSFEGP